MASIAGLFDSKLIGAQVGALIAADTWVDGTVITVVVDEYADAFAYAALAETGKIHRVYFLNMRLRE